MKPVDLSVIVTLHSESVVAGPTICSAEAAVAHAERQGFSVECLLAFDTPSDACRAFFDQPAYARWTKCEFRFRDQGKTRNTAIADARGRWVALLDGDDLFSENWLTEALKLLSDAEAQNRRVVVHPELNWIFDAGQFVFAKPNQSDALFSSFYFSCANYYDALCVAPRQAWIDHPYPDRAVKDGFAYEDWQWGVETLAAGWVHVTAPNTIIFKRRRDSSQTHESRSNTVMIRAIEATAIDGILARGPRSARAL